MMRGRGLDGRRLGSSLVRLGSHLEIRRRGRERMDVHSAAAPVHTRYDNGATSVDGLAPTPEGENKGACLGQGKSKKRSSLALASSEQLGLWPGKTKRCG